MNIINSSTSNDICNNKYLIGFIMILINLGARFIVNELNEDQLKIVNSTHVRRIMIYLVIFMATRDVFITLFIGTITILIIKEYFNNESDNSLIKKENKNTNISEKIKNIEENLKDLKNLNESKTL
tara:strand:- start:516 stop:893 length:378 start_codon:yes stop_codon:yes gene_type:complete